MKASSTYPQEKVRDKEWVHKMGAAPSIMDYARFNYVAQPEDKIAVEDLVPRIGPYDVWATKWGYTPIPDAKTAEEEKPTLDKWAHEQDTTPWFRFSTANSAGSDPGELTEAIGDADAIKSTTAGREEPAARGQDADARHHRQGGRALRRSGRTLRAHAGAVDARDGPRGGHCRRIRHAREIRRAGGPAVHPGAQGAPGGGGEVPQ